MRHSLSIAVAGLASLTLSGCEGFNWDRFAGLPIVCPSSIDVDSTLIPQGLIRFRPHVENRGVDDNKAPFDVYMRVTRFSGGTAVEVLKHNYISNGVTIFGTHAMPGVKAGPEVELLTTNTLGPRTTAYDRSALYLVTLDFKSSDPAIDLAGDTCRHLEARFKGGLPA